MIVVNKADSVELPKNGLGSEEISDIMEYESVEKMYSSGIYFVSSVMGLGAVNPEGIVSDYPLACRQTQRKHYQETLSSNCGAGWVRCYFQLPGY